MDSVSSDGITASDQSFVSILPGVSILGVLSNLSYEPWYAIAEYVDNSIQSYRKSLLQLSRSQRGYQLRVDISYEHSGGGFLSITDNAAGIKRDEFSRAFRAAEVPPDRTGLSEFGMGMKSASIWFAKNWRVITTSIGDPREYTVEFDMNQVLEKKYEILEVTDKAIAAETHFTRIELWNLNQFLPGRTLGKVRDHLREMYRGFLRSGELALTVRGESMRYDEPAILKFADYRSLTNPQKFSSEEIEWKKELEFFLKSGVRVFGWVAIRAEGKMSGFGISLFRRGRVIVGTTNAPFKPSRIFGHGNSFRSQRLFGELEIDGLPVSHTKDAFQWQGQEDEFEDKLRDILDAEPMPLLKQAENYRARKANQTDLQRIRRAAENTASVSASSLPAVLPEVTRIESDQHDSVASLEAIQDPGGNSQFINSAEEPYKNDFSKSFEFSHDDRVWSVTIEAAERIGEPRWLISHTDVYSGSDKVSLRITVNIAHRLLQQFVVGDSDALEAVFRIAVAMVVSECLMGEVNDGAPAARFLRQVNTILSGNLSNRMGE